tara:strand:- start:385 stop:927 length:543 start_codon:yes stop_codon:yes gene_type:complete
MEIVKEFFNLISLIDLIYLLITILSLINCYRKGFVLSVLAIGKWLVAYIATLIVFPKAKPYFKGVIDNEFILDLFLGVIIFVIMIFLVFLINRGISKAVKYTGLGSLDSAFGFFFGFVRSYIISVFLFTAIHIVYNYDKWPLNSDKSYIFPYLEKGSNYLLREFPNEKTYQDSKEKIENL